MSTRTKYTVWVRCRYNDAGYEIPRGERIWEVSETPCTVKQADQDVREVRHDFDCRTIVLPVGRTPITE